MLNFRDDKHWYGITHDGRDTIGAHRLNTLPFPKCSSISLLLPCGWMSFLSLLEVLHIHHLPLRTFRIFCILTGQSVESAKSARGNHQKNRSKADVSTMHNRIDNKHRFYASYEGLEAKSAQGSEYLVWSVARLCFGMPETALPLFQMGQIHSRRSLISVNSEKAGIAPCHIVWTKSDRNGIETHQ